MAKLTFNAITVICTGNICRSPLENDCCAGCFPPPGSIQREFVARKGAPPIHRRQRSPPNAAPCLRATWRAGSPRHGARLRSDSGDGAGTYRAGHGYRTGGARQNDALWSLDGQKEIPDPYRKTGTHLNMFMGCWSRPVWNGRNGSVNHTG